MLCRDRDMYVRLVFLTVSSFSVHMTAGGRRMKPNVSAREAVATHGLTRAQAAIGAGLAAACQIAVLVRLAARSETNGAGAGGGLPLNSSAAFRVKGDKSDGGGGGGDDEEETKRETKSEKAGEVVGEGGPFAVSRAVPRVPPYSVAVPADPGDVMLEPGVQCNGSMTTARQRWIEAMTVESSR